MNPITHDQAHQYLLMQADGLLDSNQQSALQNHIEHCSNCRAEAAQLANLQTDLHTTFKTRWDQISVPDTPLVTEPLTVKPIGPRLGRMAANLVLLVLWILLYRAVFGYLGIIFYQQEFRVNQILLAAVSLLIFSQVRHARLQPHLDRLPHIYLPALITALGASIAYLLVERFLDINTLSATLFALATYGLLGLWLSPERWYRGLPIALLLVGTLPFGEHMQTFIGYPVRLVTASIVGDGFSALGIHSVGVDTILVMESGFAQVDNPCSGIKSLWTGMLFILAVTWLERHPINKRWFGTVISAMILFLTVNLARVGILVLVDQVFGWHFLAEMIHIPLGVLGFVMVCGLVVLLLRDRNPGLHRVWSAFIPNGKDNYPRPVWLVPVLAVIIAGMALLYSPRGQTASAQATLDWVFPAAFHAQSDPLSPGLYDWVTEGGAETADRWRFIWQEAPDQTPINGSVMFIASTDWRAQHRPERCFEVQGLFVNSNQTTLMDTDFPVKQLLLDGGGQQVSAAYWLQTSDFVTDDYAKRIWADLTPDRSRWVLVTVLFDDVYSLDGNEMNALFENIRAVVAQGLVGSP